jgi:dienelactone hydrolase
MLSFKNNSDTLIIVLHEIYGINQHIRKVCEHYYSNGYDVICPNLNNIDKPFSYGQQKEAYRHFIKNIGFEEAFQKVKKLIIQAKSQYKSVFLLGFSIGATIAWLCSNKNRLCDGVIGYYGSRIRDYLDVTPECPVLLLFPAEEESFNVKELIESVKRINVDVYELSGKHGFSDPFNDNYCEPPSMEAKKLVENFLRSKAKS